LEKGNEMKKLLIFLIFLIMPIVCEAKYFGKNGNVISVVSKNQPYDFKYGYANVELLLCQMWGLLH
jgi:hypothetical protein